MKGLFSVVVVMVAMLAALVPTCSAQQCFDGSCGPVVSEYPQVVYGQPVAINWDQACAIESAQMFAQCKAAGGGRWACLAQAGLHYWTCSGSTSETAAERVSRPGGRLRAVTTGFRAVRRGR